MSMAAQTTLRPCAVVIDGLLGFETVEEPFDLFVHVVESNRILTLRGIRLLFIATRDGPARSRAPARLFYIAIARS